MDSGETQPQAIYNELLAEPIQTGAVYNVIFNVIFNLYIYI